MTHVPPTGFSRPQGLSQAHPEDLIRGPTHRDSLPRVPSSLLLTLVWAQLCVWEEPKAAVSNVLKDKPSPVRGCGLACILWGDALAPPGGSAG